MKEIIVNIAEEGQTIHKFLKKYLKNAPLSLIEKIFRTRDIKVNDYRVDKAYILKNGDKIKLYLNDEQLVKFKEIKKPISKINLPKIIFEDQNVLIAFKPSGILVHGDEKEKTHTLLNQTLSYLNSKGEYNPGKNTFIPSPAHRLDRNTMGLVVFGKNIKTLQQLEILFQNKEYLEKHYLALVLGNIKEEGLIDKPLQIENNIARFGEISDGAKKALTTYKPIGYFDKYTLLDITLLTGRTHQIRAHLMMINHPIIGDTKYGNKNENLIFEKNFSYNHQFLIANKLSFKKIEDHLSYLSNQTFECSIPKKEIYILNQLSSK